MRRKQIQHHIDALIALLLFGVFAACVLAVLLTGADAYRRLTARDQAAYDRRSCTQYIATKVRQSDIQDSVSVTDIQGVPALMLGSGEEFVTYIYCHDGWLRELYIWCEEPAAPEDGRELTPAEGLDLSLEDGLLTVQVTDAQGGEDTLLLSLRSEGGWPVMKSKAPLAMMEQIVMLLVFALAAALCLQAFVKSDQLSKRSEARDRAAVLCQNAAETLQHCKGDMAQAAALLAVPYPYDWEGSPLEIHYNQDWTLCNDREYAYCLRAALVDSGVAGLGKGYVSVTETGSGEVLFELDVAWQQEVFAHG